MHHIFQVVPLPRGDGAADDFLVIVRVVGIHIDDRFISDGRVETAAMQLVARLGYSEYATVTEAWRMRRPDWPSTWLAQGEVIPDTSMTLLAATFLIEAGS